MKNKKNIEYRWMRKQTRSVHINLIKPSQQTNQRYETIKYLSYNDKKCLCSL